MSDTPRFNSYWNSYRSGAISVEEFKEAVQNLERENAALLFLQKQDKENYQCAMKASMNIEEQLKAENAALREAAVEVCAIGRVWITVWGDKLSPESIRRFDDMEQRILKEAQP